MFKPFPEDDNRISSANVQAEIYHQCRNVGLDCRCEYLHYFQDDRATQYRMSIDCAVIHDGYVACVAEAKRYSDPSRMTTLDTQQAWNYSLLPIPAYYVSRRKHAVHFACLAQGIIQGAVPRRTRYGQIRVILDGPNGNPKADFVTVKERSNE